MENESENDEQMMAIQAKKNGLFWNAIGMVILSGLVSCAFYAVTILQNPALKPERE